MARPRFGISLALTAIIGLAAALAIVAAERPPLEGWRMKTVVIPKGSTTPEILSLLAEEGVLRRPFAFRLIVHVTMTGRILQHGEYTFPAPPSAFEVWRKLVRGDVARYNVTIPEGSNLYDIAQILGGLDLADPKTFVDAATSPALAARLGVPGRTLEGFLFPDTYLLVRRMPEEEIIAIMVRQFRRRVTPDMEGRAREAGFSLAEIVTIASIIEKETGVEEEKPLVSAVIRKRLALGMPLQMDPTVIYGLKKFGGNLTRKDLKARNAYNSYVHRGLPPGPIANPGLSSLAAALSPPEADFLYFVSRNDGSHEFTATLTEHNRAVATYQKKGKGKEGGEPTPRPRPQGPS